MPKSTLPDNFRYEKAHTSKWAVFYGLNELVGWVRKIKTDLRGSSSAFWLQEIDNPNHIGPFAGKDEAAQALIKRWKL